MGASLSCQRCDWSGDPSNLYACPVCGSSLLVTYAKLPGLPHGTDGETRGVWRYQDFLPVSNGIEPISLGEGDTALLQASGLGPTGELFLKNETTNPTGSFKDRPVSVAATVARELGLSGLVCASTGNTGVAVSAYAARSGLPAACVVPVTTPPAKLRQIEASGARVVRVRGDYSDAYAMALAAAEEHGWANLTSTYVNPYMLEGDKTIAYEIFEDLGGRTPDWVLVPVGAGPLLAAIHKGFGELGMIGEDAPRMVAVQAAGCAPIVRAFEAAEEEVGAWDDPVETASSSIADALRGYPEDGTRTLSVVRETSGRAIAVSEEETHGAVADLARTEGLFVEPGAAVVVAAYRRLVEENAIEDGETTVLVLTGHGLKDPDALAGMRRSDTPVVEPGDIGALGEILEVRG